MQIFVSYTKRDEAWALWIAWQLELDGEHECTLQKRDFSPGENFVLNMHKAVIANSAMLVVLSQAYLEAPFPTQEWTAMIAAMSQDPTKKLIPVRIERCKNLGLLGALSWIDLTSVTDEDVASKLLRECISTGGARANQEVPVFPPSAKAGETSVPPLFPNAPASEIPDKYRELVRGEFLLVQQQNRGQRPAPGSRTATLLFGYNLPFGSDRARPRSAAVPSLTMSTSSCRRRSVSTSPQATAPSAMRPALHIKRLRHVGASSFPWSRAACRDIVPNI